MWGPHPAQLDSEGHGHPPPPKDGEELPAAQHDAAGDQHSAHLLLCLPELFPELHRHPRRAGGELGPTAQGKQAVCPRPHREARAEAPHPHARAEMRRAGGREGREGEIPESSSRWDLQERSSRRTGGGERGRLTFAAPALCSVCGWHCSLATRRQLRACRRLLSPIPGGLELPRGGPGARAQPHPSPLGPLPPSRAQPGASSPELGHPRGIPREQREETAHAAGPGEGGKK